MARTYAYSPGQKTVAASTTLVWTPAEIDAAGVVAFHLIVAATGNTLADIDRVRVKANGQTVIDVTVPELQAYQERFSPKGASDLVSGAALTIPLNVMDGGSDDNQDKCQFMPGASATVEVVFNAGAVAGTALLGWTKTTIDPEYYMTLIGTPMGVSGAQNGYRVPLSAPGFVQGFGIEMPDLSRIRVVLGGLEVVNLPGVQFGTAAGDMIRESQALYDAPDDASDISSFQFLKLNQGLEANSATSWVEVYCTGSMAATDELALYTLVPVAPVGQ